MYQCDQTRPACIRCTRIKRVCPGYRDVSSLLFRDESRAVARKANKSAASSSGPNSPSASSRLVPQRSGTESPTLSLFHAGDAAEDEAEDEAASSSSSSAADTSSPGSGRDQVAPFIPANPFKLDEKFEATCFFFDSFAWIYSGVMQKCDLSGVSSSSTPLAQKALANAISSVGMANISSIQRSKSLRMAAWREYAEALKWTNAAISDREQATEDATLASILCLSMFEVCHCACCYIVCLPQISAANEID